MTRDYLSKWQRSFDAARRLAPNVEKTIGCDDGGYYAEFYDEDTEMVGRWYGTRDECEAIGAESVEMYPVRRTPERPDPFDLACERRYD